MRALLIAALALTCTTAGSQAQAPNATELADRAIHRRAVEAMIWGMPAVNYDLMLQAMLTTTTAKPNQIVYWSRPVNWRNQTLTPNPDAIYFMTFTDTRNGPIVIEVPPAESGSIAGNIVTVWQMPLEDAGPAGADEGRGGKFLILPPDYKDAPPDGFIALRSDTYGGYALLRVNLPSHTDADIARSVAYGKLLRVYPLSQAANPVPTIFTDAYDVLFDSTIRYDASFFRSLDRIVQTEPWLQRDRAMIDSLRMIGIEKGKPFNPDRRVQGILDAAAREAQAVLAQRYDAGFPVMNQGIRWFPAAVPEVVRAVSSGYANPDEYPVDARGVTYTLGYIGIKRLGTAQFYLMANKDKAGADFDGAATYRLTVPANAPVKQYWSVTVYDRETHALIKDLDRASRASNAADMQKNADGSVDVYFGPRAPAGKETNWVPTDPARKFELLFRLYGPEKAFFDKDWKLPDAERIAGGAQTTGNQ